MSIFHEVLNIILVSVASDESIFNLVSRINVVSDEIIFHVVLKKQRSQCSQRDETIFNVVSKISVVSDKITFHVVLNVSVVIGVSDESILIHSRKSA